LAIFEPERENVRIIRAVQIPYTQRRSKQMKCSTTMMIALFMMALTITASAQVNASGRLTLLRVHDVGTGFGPPTDFIDVEVVIALDSQPGKFFGFQLRNDSKLPARQGMLDLMRDAFERNLIVNIDFFQNPGKNNNILFRTWLSK
jgi:hypothetical protein